MTDRSLAASLPNIAAPDDLHLLIEQLPDPLLLVRETEIRYLNAAACRLFEDDRANLTGSSWDSLLQGASPVDLQLALSDAQTSARGGRRLELRLLRADRSERILEANLAAVALAGQPYLLMSLRDISRNQQQIRDLQSQAHRDALTGLPNRSLFYDRLEREVVRSRRTGRPVALMFIDLDRFKWVNDTHGHDFGDLLLQQVTERISAIIRRSDTLARLGGDEFTLILPDMGKGPDAERVTKKILDDLGRPFQLNDQEVSISASIGISVFPDDAEDHFDLLKRADTAMYTAKRGGRNTCRFFTLEMQAEVTRRMALEHDLMLAIERDELALHYQPIIDLSNGRVLGLESFLRWQKKDSGLIPPILFLHIAEEIGLGVSLSEWVLHQACRQVSLWREHPLLGQLFITINLSCSRCRHLLSTDFLGDMLARYQLEPNRLIFEITENILNEDEESTLEHLQQLKDMGVGLWLDDFGTGQSSLSVLNRLPLDGFKIDQHFIAHMLDSNEDATLVNALLSLAGKLDLRVIAEGIESERQQTFLTDMGCRLGQGYLFGMPLPAAQLEQSLTARS